MGRIVLDRVESTTGLTVLKQGSASPVFIGTDPEGEDFLCGWCEQVVLVARARNGESWDLSFQCYACGHTSMGPKRPRGYPLPFRQTVVAPAGIYLIGESVEMRDGVVFASRESWERRDKESGYRSPEEDHTQTNTPQELSLELLRELLDRVVVLVGANQFQNLRVTHTKGRDAKGTPPKNPHRLMELVEAVEDATVSFESSNPSIHISNVIELRDAVALMERWQSDPCWPDIARAVVSPGMYAHTIITLAAASMFTDAGNGVGLQAESGSQRSADLFILTDSRHKMQVEVKAPVKLQKKAGRIDDKTAMHVVKSKLKQAGTSQGGQLGSDSPGMLVIGGFGLFDSDLALLEKAAAKLMSASSPTKSHIAGIAILSTATEITAPRITDVFPVWTGKGHVAGVVKHRFVMNPQYEGAISLERKDQFPEQIQESESVGFLLLQDRSETR